MRNEPIGRRQFLQGSMAALTVAGGALAAPNTPQPNILFLMPDQMRGDCLSILDHPVVRTPTTDQLAKDGVLFRHAYAAVPSCIPAEMTRLLVQSQLAGMAGLVFLTGPRYRCPASEGGF